MATRRLVAAAHVAPDARPRAGAGVSATLVHADRHTAVDAWVVSTGQRVAGAAITAVKPDGTWSLDLYPNDQLATPDGGATAWAIAVAGFSRVLIQMPSGDAEADYYTLAAAQTTLEPGEIAALAAHLADDGRHVPPAGAVGQIVTMGADGPEWMDRPEGGGGAVHTHTQSTAASVWTINHNLGVQPSITVLDTGGNALLAQVLHVSVNQAQIQFATPVAGIARCL